MIFSLMTDKVLFCFQVWGVAPLVYYAEAMHAGKSLPKPYENVHDDTQQVISIL